MKMSETPSYSEYLSTKAAYEADPTPANGRAWAIASAKCRKESGRPYYLPDSMLE